MSHSRISSLCPDSLHPVAAIMMSTNNDTLAAAAANGPESQSAGGGKPGQTGPDIDKSPYECRWGQPNSADAADATSDTHSNQWAEPNLLGTMADVDTFKQNAYKAWEVILQTHGGLCTILPITISNSWDMKCYNIIVLAFTQFQTLFCYVLFLLVQVPYHNMLQYTCTRRLVGCLSCPHAHSLRT